MRAQPLDQRRGAREVDEMARQHDRPVVELGDDLIGEQLDALARRVALVGDGEQHAGESPDDGGIRAGDDEPQRVERSRRARPRSRADGGEDRRDELAAQLERHAHDHAEVEQDDPAVLARRARCPDADRRGRGRARASSARTAPSPRARGDPAARVPPPPTRPRDRRADPGSTRGRARAGGPSTPRRAG